MAETRTEKKILVRLTSNIRHGKKTLQEGMLIRGPKSLMTEWIDDKAAELFDEEQIKIVEI